MTVAHGGDLVLVIGVDVGDFRPVGCADRELIVMTADDLRKVQAISRTIDNAHTSADCCKLLLIDARTAVPTAQSDRIRSSVEVRSLASLICDVVALGIADGAVVSVDPAIDLEALWSSVAGDVNRRGYGVVDHVSGWLPDGWQSSRPTPRIQQPLPK